MDNKIKITVIVPAYNVAQWLPRCMESILGQTYGNLEVLAIDDGSTDDTGVILDRFAQMDSRVTALHQRNAGLVAVRECGIAMATGEYIGFVDGDDEIEPDMYERLLENAQKHDAEISQCGILYCFYDGRKKPMHGTGKTFVFNQIEGYRELLRGTQMEPSLCNKLYRRELLQDSCPDPTIVNNEDLLRNAVLFTRAKCSVFEDFCGYHYWRRSESMSNNTRAVQNSINILRARKLIMDMADIDGWKYAFLSYMSAVMGTYNSLIGNKTAEAVQLRKKCKRDMQQGKKNKELVTGRMRYRIDAILYFPHVYNLVYKVHMKLLYARIRRQVKRCKQEMAVKCVGK